MVAACTKDEGKPGNREGLARYPAFKPYRGKLAVRNFRGGDGDVGIIRSPVRAIALPDKEAEKQFFTRAASSKGGRVKSKLLFVMDVAGAARSKGGTRERNSHV